jgi:hypothetical protein
LLLLSPSTVRVKEQFASSGVIDELIIAIARRCPNCQSIGCHSPNRQTYGCIEPLSNQFNPILARIKVGELVTAIAQTGEDEAIAPRISAQSVSALSPNQTVIPGSTD